MKKKSHNRYRQYLDLKNKLNIHKYVILNYEYTEKKKKKQSVNESIHRG